MVKADATGLDPEAVHHVELWNPGAAGLVEATVSVDCTDTPTELVFGNVPAEDHRRGVVRCPPGTTDPQVSVESWIRE